MRRNRFLSLTLALLLTLALILPASAYDSAGMDTVQTLSGGGGESFVIDSNGSLWAWGSNEFGQLGDGTTTDRTAPVKVLDNVRSVSAGDGHTYAVLEDNTLWAWGRNISDSFPDSSYPTGSAAPVKIMDDVVSASTGTCTHLAVKTDGTLWAWGKYVGDRTTKQHSEPVQIMDNVSAACTGYSHSLALKTNGSLYAWGLNNDGVVGDGTSRVRPTPTKVLSNVVCMSAGYGFSAAVKADGTLWTWGANGQGELGDGTIWPWGSNWDWHSPDPEEEVILQDTLAIWIEMWGAEANRDHSVPFQILDQTVAVYASNNNGYALRSDGSLWGWGSNVCGAVGDGTTIDRLSPVKVLDNVTKVSTGWDHVLAQRSDGSLWTWGSNICGQLGDGQSGFYSNYIPRFSAKPIQIMENTHTTDATPSSRPAGWAQEAVDEAIGFGFVPLNLREHYSQTITRAEFCALAVQFYEACTGAEIEGRTSFPDTSDLNVEKAAYLNIVSGTESGAFVPNAPLNREQAAVILTSLAQAVGSPLLQAAPAFDDNTAISGWARDAVGRVQSAGIMVGVGGSFLPQGTYTREQSIVTILNLYRLMIAEA